MISHHYKVSFDVEPENSSLLVAEAFGIGPGWTNRIVDVFLPDPLPAITLITGESGCGKSTLLRQLGTPTNFEAPNKPLHGWAASDQDALKLLNSVGLNDASLFVLRYEQLSDSQQARAKMYYWLCCGVKVLFVDEFLSTLDRKTAQALAFSFQHTLRRDNIHLVAATAHADLDDFLQPDLVVRGTAFPSSWVTEKRSVEAKNPFLTAVSIQQETELGKPTIGGICKKCGNGVSCECPAPEKAQSAGKVVYQRSRLGEIHYKGKYTGGRQEYFSARIDNRIIGWLVGVVSRQKGFQISRVVVHPTYRGCGIGQRLVKAYLTLHPDAFTIAAMARFNPVFERAGMWRVADIEVSIPPQLKNLPLTPFQWASKEECAKVLRENPSYHQIVVDAVPPLGAEIMPGGAEPREGRKEYVRTHVEVAAAVVWRRRPKTMAKYVGPSHPRFGKS